MSLSYQIENVKKEFDKIQEKSKNKLEKFISFDTFKPKSDSFAGFTKLCYPLDIFKNESYSNSFTAFFISFKDDPILEKNPSKNLTTIDASLRGKGSSVLGSIGQLDPKNGQERLRNMIVGGASGYAIGKKLGKFVDQIPTANLKVKAGLKVAETGVAVGFGEKAAEMNKNAKWFDFSTDRKTQKTCIVLPTPKLISSYSFEWKDTENKLMGGIFAAGTDFFTKLSDNVSGSAFDSFLNSAGSAVMATALETPMFGTSLSAGTREAANPRKEQVFGDVPFREFSFEYTFGPTSKKEAEEVEKIIEQFKYHAHPSIRDNTNGNLLNYPSEFDIVHFHGNERNVHLPRHTTSVLSSVEVDYGAGGDNYTFFENGMPSVIKMNLKFVEIAMLTKEDIIKGY